MLRVGPSGIHDHVIVPLFWRNASKIPRAITLATPMNASAMPLFIFCFFFAAGFLIGVVAMMVDFMGG